MTKSFVNNVVIAGAVTDVEHPAHGHAHHVLIHVTVGVVVKVLVVVILAVLVIVIVIIVVVIIDIIHNVPHNCSCQNTTCKKSPNVKTFKKIEKILSKDLHLALLLPAPEVEVDGAGHTLTLLC